MNIDQNAPLHAQKEIVILAPIERVWEVLTDIERWPEWQPDVATASLDDPLRAGTGFRWKAKGLAIASTIQEFDPPRRIGWTGRSTGMGAIHRWTLEPAQNGTRVTTQESLSGWLTRLLKISDPRFLEKSLAGSLQVLKAQVERSLVQETK